MTGTGTKSIVALGLTLTLGLVPASVAAGQSGTTDGMHNATRLGGSTAFYSPPLRTAEGLKQMTARRGMAEDIRSVLGESGIPETADAVLATLAGATSSVAGGFCDQATPADGTIVACDVQPGSTLLWMAYRPNAGKGIRTPGRIERVRWAGAKAFKALLFRVTKDDRIYTFVVPMECANLSLMSVKEQEIAGAPIDLSVDRSCDPNTGVLRATVKAAGKDLGRVQRVRVAINGQPAGDLTAPSWTLVSDKPGEYTFEATDTRGRSYPVAPRSIPVEACPPPVKAPQIVGPTCDVALSFVPVRGAYDINVDATRSTTGASGIAPTVTVEVRDAGGAMVGETLTLDSSLNRKITVRRPGSYRATATVTTPQGTEVGGTRYEGSATCEADVVVGKGGAGGPGMAAGLGSLVPFFDVLGGKERRVRPIEDTNLDYAQCAPLLGLKFGIAKRFQNDWEVAGALGAAISFVSGDDKVRESALFLDAEVNKYMAGGAFIGTGLSLWDLTRSDTMTPAWLLHFGLPLAKNATYPVFFIGEGRLFFDHIDDVSSNYLLWAGIRVHLQRR